MEAKRKAVDPLEPERHRCARVEISSNHSRDRGSAMNVTTYGLPYVALSDLLPDLVRR